MTTGGVTSCDMIPNACSLVCSSCDIRMAGLKTLEGAGMRVLTSQDSENDFERRDKVRLITDTGFESSLPDLDWMREDKAACLGSDRQVDTGIIDSEGMDVDNTFSHSDSGMMFMHEDASEGAEADVRLGVIGRITTWGQGQCTKERLAGKSKRSMELCRTWNPRQGQYTRKAQVRSLEAWTME